MTQDRTAAALEAVEIQRRVQRAADVVAAAITANEAADRLDNKTLAAEAMSQQVGWYHARQDELSAVLHAASVSARAAETTIRLAVELGNKLLGELVQAQHKQMWTAYGVKTVADIHDLELSPLIGQAVIRLGDDSATPVVGEIQAIVDDDYAEVVWPASHTPAREPFDDLFPWGPRP